MEACRVIRHWSPVKSLRLIVQATTSSSTTRPLSLIRMSTGTSSQFHKLSILHFRFHSYSSRTHASAAAYVLAFVGRAKRSIICASFSSASGERPRHRAYDGLLLDAGGTLLQLAKPIDETYSTIGKKFGIDVKESEIKLGFKRAFAAPWPEKLRYQGDGRAFWKVVVSEATGCSDNAFFEEVYEHYAHGDAWRLPVGAYEGLRYLKDAGVKLAVVSNFDSRLRKVLNELSVAQLFDAIIISSEVGFEKPAAGIFLTALDHIGVEAGKVVHVGDDQKADKVGANSVGIECWLWGSDVKSFSEICERILIADS